MFTSSVNLDDYLLPETETMREFFLDDAHAAVTQSFLQDLSDFDDIQAWEVFSAETHYSM